MKPVTVFLICIVTAWVQILDGMELSISGFEGIPPSQFGPADNKDTENVCLMEIDQGKCRGSIRKYAYDQTINQCVPFMWSGCGGNRNRFAKKAACERACRTSFN